MLKEKLVSSSKKYFFGQTETLTFTYSETTNSEKPQAAAGMK